MTLSIFAFSAETLKTRENVFSDNFSVFKKNTNLDQSAVRRIESCGYTAAELRKWDIPKNWNIDWASFPAKAFVEKTERGVHVISTEAELSLVGPRRKLGNRNFFVTVHASNPDAEKEATLSIGCIERSLVKYGEDVVKQAKLGPNESCTIACTMSCLDGYFDLSLMLKVHGNVLIHDISVESEPEPNVSCLEGTLKKCSVLPESEVAEYPDRRFTVQFEGSAILRGDYCKRELSLDIDVLLNYEGLKSRDLKEGDKVCCSIILTDLYPYSKPRVPVSNDLSLTEQDQYLVLGIETIEEFSAMPTVFAEPHKSYSTVFERHINPEIAEELKNLQHTQIILEQNKMRRLHDEYPANKQQFNETFDEKWKIEQAKDVVGRNRIKGSTQNYVWRLLKQSFWSLPEHFTLVSDYRQIPEEKIQALLAFKTFLEANGVQLIVSVVPDLYDISARVMNPEFKNVPDFRCVIAVEQLLEAGIEAVYISDELIANFNRYPFAFFYPTNRSPAETTQDILAEDMAKRLERYQFVPNLDRKQLAKSLNPNGYTIQIPKDCDSGTNQAGTDLFFNGVTYKNKKIFNDINSPILVLGNYFIQTPMQNENAYSDLLSFHLGHTVNTLRENGTGPMTHLMQRLFANPELYLKGKKVLILQNGINFLYENVLWNNFQDMDNNQKTLAEKQLVMTVIPDSSPIGEYTQQKVLVDYWNQLADKYEYLCLDEYPVAVAVIECNEIDAEKEIRCVIPICLFPGANGSITVNNRTKRIPGSSSRGIPTWSNLVFDLPAGTKEIEISVSGSPHAIVAIQKIMLLQ